MDTINRFGIIESTIEMDDWYSQMEELKTYLKDLNGEVITIEVSQCSVPTPNNLRQPLLGHQDKPENVEVIEEEEEPRELHKEIIERIKLNQKSNERVMKLRKI
jgi:hypothetical protein